MFDDTLVLVRHTNSPTRGSWSIEPPLHEDQIEPAPKLMSHLTAVSYAFEPEPLMKANRGRIRGVDTAQHDMLLLRAGEREQGFHQLAANPLATIPHPDVYRVLDGIPVSRPGTAPVPERREPTDHFVCHRHQDRIAGGGALVIPAAAVLQGHRCECVDRG